jgi:ADP-heptose:LPS heptosyltransferase
VNLRTKQRVDLALGIVLTAVLKPMARLLGRMLRRDHTLQVNGDITVIKMLGGGSIVLALPALLGLRRRYPDRRLTLICTGATQAFAETLGVFDDFIRIDDRSIPRLMSSSVAALASTWRKDTIIDLEVNSRLTTIFSLLTCARNRICFYVETSYWRKGLATHLFFFNRAGPAPRFYEQIATALDATIPPVAECRAHFRRQNRVDDRLPARVEADDGSGDQRIGLGCFCSDLALERMFSAGEWVDVLRRSDIADGAQISLYGGPGDREKAAGYREALAAALPAMRVQNLAGQLSLGESIRAIAEMDRFWSIDSGLLHIARLLGVPTTSF